MKLQLKLAKMGSINITSPRGVIAEIFFRYFSHLKKIIRNLRLKTYEIPDKYRPILILGQYFPE
jgi:hypothetical protein